MRGRKTLGILTDPSKTFKISLGNRIIQTDYNKLTEEFKNKKQSFLNFLGGNFQEIITLLYELSSIGNVSVVLYVDRNLFVSNESRISPWQMMHPKMIREYLDFNKWINGKDCLIISLCAKNLREFLNAYGRRLVQTNKLCIISTGKTMIAELNTLFQGNFTFVERKGVARFGAENRRRILALLG
jgi:hypothetical protein